jgi:hypothetical protein
MTKLILLCALVALVALPLLADGTVTQGNTNPITSWKLGDLRFPGLDERRDVAVAQVKFFHADNTVEHVTEISISGAEYASLLVALNTPSGADEATLTVTYTDPDGATTTRPDLAAIFRLRISRWLVTHTKISGVTADAVQ